MQSALETHLVAMDRTMGGLVAATAMFLAALRLAASGHPKQDRPRELEVDLYPAKIKILFLFVQVFGKNIDVVAEGNNRDNTYD